jgi:hypothetical protein
MRVAFNGDHVLKGGCKVVHFLYHNANFCKVSYDLLKFNLYKKISILNNYIIRVKTH